MGPGQNILTQVGSAIYSDRTLPNPSILLTSNDKEVDLSLTRVLFDPTWRDVFDPKGKNLKIWDF